MSRSITLAVVMIVLFVNSACMTKVYTNTPREGGQGDVLNHDTQDDIAKKYGPPTSKQALSDGGEVWAYDYPETTTRSGNQKQATSVSPCYRVIYVFDEGKVLRDLRREGC
jgi:hypothetical protein